MLSVTPPAQPKSSPPMRVPVISIPALKPSQISPNKSLPPPPPLIPISATTSHTGPVATSVSADDVSITHTQTPNGFPNSASSSSMDADVKFRTPKPPTPQKPPSTPLSEEVNLNPAEYKYVVKLVNKPETKLAVFGKLLRCVCVF